ncbi:hypothetical protein [Aquibacillus salsiterrae]|uniref:DUF4030 domain-containing protein n=1 Tax=Aquibacillus salsiterrae TaxID=2950439 RepID=A0A9X4AGV2_9BACI|nr:hypothetical protein [Aquibacillus salsiterrae]MDC3417655.1 hypothetical protein [Aquibacillus salsiterrae]
MKKIIGLFSGILITFSLVGFSSNNFFDKSIVNNVNTTTENPKPKPLSEETSKEINKTLEDIKTELLLSGYNIATVSSSHPSNEIVIKVVGTQGYFDSVKGNVKNSVKKIIEQTILEEHLVIVTRQSHSTEEEKFRQFHKEMFTITGTLSKGLQDYDEVGNIKADYQKSITIETKIKGTDEDVQSKMKEIKKKAKELLNSPELKSVSNIQSYEIYINNTND